MQFATIKQQDSRVIVKFEGQPTCMGDCQHYLDLLDVVYGKEREFVILYDARNIGWIAFKYIRTQVKFMRAREKLTRRWMKRAAIVVSSAAAKKMLETIFKIRRPAAPCEIFLDVDSAKQYLQDTTVVTPVDEVLEDASLTMCETEEKQIEEDYISLSTQLPNDMSQV